MLANSEKSRYSRQRNNYMARDLDKALEQSDLLPVRQIQVQGMTFETPTKWLVAFIGDFKGVF